MSRPVFVGVGVLMTLLAATVAWAQAPASAPATAPATTGPAIVPATQPALPVTDFGLHDLFCTARINGKDRQIAYTIFIPRGYDPSKKWPILVYLVGRGDRGSDHQRLYNNGPVVYLKTDPKLADWAPFIMLAPQCPADARWEEEGMPQLVLDILEMVRANWSVDPARMYITGLSMGGQGTWNVALHAKGIFAVVSPFCAIEVAAEQMCEAVKGSSVCIICGGADGNFTAGSRKMYSVLRDHHIDVVYAEVPNKAHGVWPEYYSNRRYYEYLLLHQLGQKPPTTRPSADELVEISYTPPNSADRQLLEPLRTFLPWWFVSNCGKSHEPGLHAELLGRKNVFVTTPLGDSVPCRLLFTTQIPAGKKTTLNMTVAANTPGQWELIVRADGNELVKKVIGAGDPPPPPASTQASTQPATAPATQVAAAPATAPTTAPALPPNDWVDVSVDLTPLAGSETHLEVINQRTNSKHSEAYWAAVRIESK